MSRGIISRYKSCLVGVLLLTLSAYYINSSMFYHTHEIAGETIFHSHFYSDEHTNSEDGGHTLELAKLIAILGNITLEEQNFDSHVASPELCIEREIVALNSIDRYHAVELHPSLRAPPTL